MRHISPITAEERMASSVLRAAKALKRSGVECHISQAELDEVKIERDRLRELRGYGRKPTKPNRKTRPQAYDWVTDLIENADNSRGQAIRELVIAQLTRLQ